MVPQLSTVCITNNISSLCCILKLYFRKSLNKVTLKLDFLKLKTQNFCYRLNFQLCFNIILMLGFSL